jgi:hypothetical protein
MQDSDGTGRASVNCDNGSLNLKFNSNNAVGTSTLTFSDYNSERMRIDSSGNLLVGKTAVSMAAVGVEVKPFGEVRCTASEAQALQLNRLSTDGTIADFRKDGTSVGSIGTTAGRLFIGHGDVALRLAGDLDFIAPWNASTNAARDNAISLGNAGNRFKDLYLSGTAYSGNLLVGTTANPSGTVEGIRAASNGVLYAASAGTAPLVLYRHDSDGNILNFHKDGASVGSIGTASGTLVVGSTNGSGSYLKFGSNVVAPVDTNGAVRDNAIDLGQTNARFKDLHLSGSIRGDKYDIYTEGSGSLYQTDGYLRFSNGNTETARIDASGNFYVGTSGLAQPSTGAFTVNAVGANTNIRVGHATGTASGNWYTAFYYGSNVIGSISQNGTGSVTYNTTSDERLKENIKDSEDAGDKIDAIKIRQFDWKDDGKHQDYGVVAQELLPVAPEAVTEGKTEDDMMQVDYSKLVPTLIKEIQTLRNRVAQLENN